MKRNHIIRYIWAVIAAVVLYACSEAEPYGKKLAASYYLEIDNSSLTFDGKGSQDVQVQASADLDWTIANHPSWIYVSSSNTKGNATLTITVKEDNPQTTARTGTVTLRNERFNLSASVDVSQEGTWLKVDKNSLSFPVDGGAETITITSNADWEVKDCPSWLSYSPEKGSAGTNTVTLTADENSGNAAQSGTVRISCKSGSINIPIDVSQKEPFLKVNIESLPFSWKGGEAVFDIESNISWTIENYSDWYTVTPLSGKGNKRITVNVKNNTGNSARDASLIVRNNWWTLFQSVNVSQERPPYLDVSTTEISCHPGADSYYFDITSNTSWQVSSDATWCTVSPTKDKNSKTIKVTVKANTEGKDRTAYITVTGTDVTKKTIKVVQKYDSTDVDLDDFGGDKKL